MPTGQQYATGVPQATLSTGISPSTTSFGLNSLSGWPATPFTAVLDIGTSSQEAIDVITVSGNNITNCTRGIDGTVAQSHNGTSGTLTHADIGRDFREPRAHIDAATSPDSTGHDIHGIGSGNSVVGTGTSQTLTNKTIATGTFTGNQSMGSGTWSGSGTLTEGALGVTGLVGANNAGRLAGATNGGPPVSGTFVTGDMVEDLLYGTLWVCTAGGTPGTWVPVGGEVNVAEVALGSAAATMSATVPSWAKTVRVHWSGRSSAGVTNVMTQFNGDTGSNYLWQEVQAENAGSSASNSGGAATSIQIGVIPGSASTANYFGSGDFVISNSGGSLFKTAVGKSVALNTSSDSFVGIYGGQWNSTSAITSVLLKNGTGNFVTGSTMTVYAGT